MKPSPLESLVAAGKLHPEPFDQGEYEGLVASGRVRLTHARRADLSLESRFDLACNAAHSLCIAALRRAGFRPADRDVVFQVLPETLGLGSEVWRVLDKGHRLRDDAEHEGHVNVEARLVEDVIEATRRVSVALDSPPKV